MDRPTADGCMNIETQRPTSGPTHVAQLADHCVFMSAAVVGTGHSTKAGRMAPLTRNGTATLGGAGRPCLPGRRMAHRDLEAAGSPPLDQQVNIGEAGQS
uniref:Uncharacterized protein n=1 Tax=Eutreptiella gymnastica TaxID=73025 RepID=A0A7S4LA58_9EUGL